MTISSFPASSEVHHCVSNDEEIRFLVMLELLHFHHKLSYLVVMFVTLSMFLSCIFYLREKPKVVPVKEQVTLSTQFQFIKMLHDCFNT